MQNENSIHADDVTCDIRQVIFVCTYSAYSYNFQNRAGLQREKVERESCIRTSKPIHQNFLFYYCICLWK